MSEHGPPSDLVTRHRWREKFPSFLTHNAVNVIDHGAVGDGTHDDSVALQRAVAVASGTLAKTVFLPRGVYAIGTTINVTDGVSLVGVAKHLSRIVAAPGFYQRKGQVTPLVQVVNDANATTATTTATTALAFFSITVWNSVSNVSALHWSSNGGTTRQIHFNRASTCGSTPSAACHQPPTTINHPMMLVTGPRASLKVYTFFLEDCCKSERFPWVGGNGNDGFWKGWLAGPQGPGKCFLS